MGLAGSFGNQGYVCESCGQVMMAYSPNCPACSNKTACTPKNIKAPNPQGADAPSTTAGRAQQGGPGLSVIVVAGVVVALAGAYAVFGPKQDDKANIQSTPVSASSQPPQERPRPRRIKTATPAQSSRPHRTAASTPAPRRAAPMKLWEGDSE